MDAQLIGDSIEQPSSSSLVMHPCTMCNKMFMHERTLKRHAVVHSNESPFVCRECGKQYSQAYDLERHSRCHRNERPFSCRVCGKQFSLSHHLNSHMATHTGLRPFTCYVCDKQFAQTFSLKRHMRIHTQQLAPGISIMGGGNNPQTMSASGISVVSDPRAFSALGISMVTDARAIACGRFTLGSESNDLDEASTNDVKVNDVINANGGSVYTISLPLQLQPAGVASAAQLTRTWSCPACAKTCGSRQTLKRHMLQHDGYGPSAHACSVCGKRFLQAYELNRHEKCHARHGNVSFTAPVPQRMHACTECGIEYASIRHVNAHVAVAHPGRMNKPYACASCTKRFAHPYSLKRHQLVHVEGSDSFVCCISTCAKRFVTAYDLERHMKTHGGEKLYACSVCDKRFTQAHHVTNHMLTHTGEKRFTCDLCLRSFAQSFTLRRHMNVHLRGGASASNLTVSP